MRKIIQYLFVAVVSFSVAGCNSMFDNETPPHNLSGENAIVDQPSAEVALNGIYSYLGSEGQMSAYYIANNEFRSGMLAGQYRGSFDTKNPEFKVAYDDSDLGNLWRNCYTIINTANNFIYYIEKVPDGKFSGNRKKEMIAEAKFMRAFSHLHLLRSFGYFWDINSSYGPIVRMEPATLSTNMKGRSTVAATYEAILEDLDYMIANGPVHYSKFNGCATLAKAYKADVLMSRGADGDYAMAATLATEVIASKEFGMENKFADIFTNGYASKELMFSRSLKNPKNYLTQNTASIYKMFCTQGTYVASDNYLEIMTPDDKRYRQTIEERTYIVGSGSVEVKQNIFVKHEKLDADCPMWYMRVAQMYLLRAEANLRTGATKKTVLDDLNVLRLRSENTLFLEKDYTTDQELMDEIFHENVREIGIENGALYYLAVRMKNNNGKRKIESFNSFYLDDNQLCYPIPKTEIDNNTIIAGQQKPM